MKNDRDIIRELASKWSELASQPVMEERKRLWKAVHDLKAERPVILIETSTIDGFVSEKELLCEDVYLRGVERLMRDTLRHTEEIGDDIVVEPYFRIGWQVETSDFGVPVEMKPATTADSEPSIGYTFNFPIATPSDFGKLKKRTLTINRDKSIRYKDSLEDLMGDILPVKLSNYDPFMVNAGNEEWTGLFFLGLTWQIYRFIGNNGLLYWLYDAPETIHKLMSFMVEDRLALFEFLQNEGVLEANTDNQMAGPRAYGYVSDLPEPVSGKGTTLKDLWCWAESQETTIVSPTMYKEFVLPYLTNLSSRFGLVYYGCCEPVDDRLEMIMEAIPNLRSVSVSGWADFDKIGEMLGDRYVYSRKPTPAYISGPNPDWGLVERDIKRTYAATKNCNVELLFRDVYTIEGDRTRLSRWVEMTKSIFGI
jgi:hypothetical protein